MKRRSSFLVLWRAFFAQLFTSEAVTSDVLLRQSIAWGLAFLLAPCLVLLINLFPQFQYVVLRVRALHAPLGLIDDMLEWVAFLLVTYSMVTVGLIAVFVWDSLTFDRRDAMVLGPLPLRGTTIVAAKLTALGVFLMVASVMVNLLNSAVFALETADNLGGAELVEDFFGALAATTGSAIFVFAAIVMLRGFVTLAVGDRLATSAGSLLQFLFVIALLSFVILSPAVWRVPFITPTGTDWLPTAWFVGLFERLRGSPRSSWPEFAALTRRALVATPIAVVGAVVMSAVAFRRQMRRALAPSASAGPLGGALISRMVATWIVGRNAVARATSDFILLSIARNRAQQSLIAINSAIGVTIIAAGLSRSARDVASLMHPRTAVLWIPLVLAYWMAVGLRASFFVPSELPASWSFRARAPGPLSAYRAGVRASMYGFIVPRTLIAIALLVPLLGWRVAAWHALIVSALVALLVGLIALTVDHIPFTRAYEPGHAKLRTRWWIYALAFYAFAYWPVRFELRFLQKPVSLIVMVGVIFAAIAILGPIGRRLETRLVNAREVEGDLPGFTVLNLG